ncbi:TetR/AcrR family transcriptional regulator C-terminal domain-containing protein [Companilactobacillus mishanensis]|uniref:TetR/AcrR family transcriptional regulator C-terminal domain-containing protein n=1 Tax=Companilactobacillus mishanensis TaxID=2486008 RepID=UPI0012960586|nr:TetR/AcrR family transcriptional regulator C-terminal domain-containing protein [Companilactobacillus mishanensis]MQS90084.1 TetR family transcriptional regulator [Companilactobacillus mishanensis]
MSATNLIDESLSYSLQELLEEKSLKDISVQDITSKSKVSRATFYRHFKDKFDLVNWIYDTMSDKISKRYYSNNNFRQLSNDSIKMMYQKKNFFKKIFEYEGQNSFTNYYRKTAMEYTINQYTTKLGIKTLDTELTYLAEFNVAGLTQATKKWVINGYKESPEEMAEILMDNLSEKEKKIFSQTEIKK